MVRIGQLLNSWHLRQTCAVATKVFKQENSVGESTITA
jgi:hypothetical protein